MKSIIAAATIALACAAAADAGQDPHPTFTVGTAVAQRGQKAYGVLRVPPGSDAGYDIPVVVVHGARPGPVLAVAAGAHGTEYASIIAVEMLIDAVKADEVAGTLILLPLINVPSFEHLTPHVNPTDNKSMNRFYPGNPAGTQTDRASYVITREVVERCDHLIDLHGGDLDENLRPYSYWTVTGNQKQDDFSREMVLAFGLDHIIISADRPKDPAASRFLENTASTRGKPSFTAEAGRSGPVDITDAARLSAGVKNVMAHLKMGGSVAAPVRNPVWVEKIVTLAADRDGMFQPTIDRDAHVARGARIGVVTDYLNRPLQDVTATEDGIIMFIRAVPSLKKGDTLANIGVVKR
ncbi:MAG TPA: succinylglutamate desuccinylase/aspartoacylase family protein [Vicinamibacterales bacterium]|nr:succinylglutamate desuccinylase/aspartoacylase family protein [Vicinamibacterales bacterium]